MESNIILQAPAGLEGLIDYRKFKRDVRPSAVAVGGKGKGKGGAPAAARDQPVTARDREHYSKVIKNACKVM